MSKKTKDLKITDEQLETLQGKLKLIDTARLQIGTLENQKFQMLNQVGMIQKELVDMQNELQEEYGKVSINITDGTITEIPEEEEDVEANKKD
jgi:hypothetical protein